MKRISGRMTDAQKTAMKQESASAERQRSRLKKLAEAPLKPVQILLSLEMHEALSEYCDRNGETISDVLRAAGMATIGRADLIATVRSSGRPRKPV